MRFFATFYKYYLRANNSKVVDWISKILISLNLLFSLGQTQDHFYPDMNIAISLVCLWLYFLRFKLIPIFLLLLGLFLHFTHYYTILLH